MVLVLSFQAQQHGVHSISSATLPRAGLALSPAFKESRGCGFGLGVTVRSPRSGWPSGLDQMHQLQ